MARGGAPRQRAGRQRSGDAGLNNKTANSNGVHGEFIDVGNERFYAIRNVDRMPPFLVSVISDDDHWLFASSNGGLTAGRVSPAQMLFPYVTVDKIHDSTSHTGNLSMLRVLHDGSWHFWEPFAATRNGPFRRQRNLYKNLLGNKLRFEEINHDLGLAYRYTWQTSARYGFVRSVELENFGGRHVEISLADGLQNILPAGTPEFAQANSSNLVDAYKWSELDRASGLAIFTLYSAITDRAEPCESLRANVAFCLGLGDAKLLLSTQQVQAFHRGVEPEQTLLTRGIRGAMIVNSVFRLDADERRDWCIVANTELTQADVAALRQELADRDALAISIDDSIRRGSDALARTMARADGLQVAAEELVSAHHHANVAFNVLRGGVFARQHTIDTHDLQNTIRHFNQSVYRRNRTFLDGLPPAMSIEELQTRVRDSGDTQLRRLCFEYLPITFGRRHGDPSRPWNRFSIRIRDENDRPRLFYEGNWRDIFQNWEALAFSYPEFLEGMIAKFVNASTIDGYNPYRITKDGIDWEVEDPDDPWSYIGYWGDHQIIYLQKLLELSQAFHPERLQELLREPIFCYANVPYRIRSFESLLADPKNSVDYDSALAHRIERRTQSVGADGKLLTDRDGDVYQVNLGEKLLVPLLAKLGNLVIDGGIWMNTQRPEWNDANNALVGQGLSMVTLYYLRRHVRFLQALFGGDSGSLEVSTEVAEWHAATAAALGDVAPTLDGNPVTPEQRLAVLRALGEASSHYRSTVYEHGSFSGTKPLPVADIGALLGDALGVIDHCIASNRRSDGLYHAYNLLDLDHDGIQIERLYPMLEGQVSALSSGALPIDAAVAVMASLFDSEIYRPDQDSFMLYPDRALPAFLDKNVVPPQALDEIPLLADMLSRNDMRLIVRDVDGRIRFNAAFCNAAQLLSGLDELAADYGDALKTQRDALMQLYEDVFRHQSFTGRSGTMFGFEGLGCVYWHMVAKLLLAVQEQFFRGIDDADAAGHVQRLGALYYRVRNGLGFNKTPGEFGAFPHDPYSHTPKHAGARQPGMTGQVKEEILTRFGELGVRVADGRASFVPRLLRAREFLTAGGHYRYLDTDEHWQDAIVPRGGLAFSWCQVPVIYRLDGSRDPGLRISFDDDTVEEIPGLELRRDLSAALFARSGRIRRIEVSFCPALLFTFCDETSED